MRIDCFPFSCDQHSAIRELSLSLLFNKYDADTFEQITSDRMHIAYGKRELPFDLYK